MIVYSAFMIGYFTITYRVTSLSFHQMLHRMILPRGSVTNLSYSNHYYHFIADSCIRNCSERDLIMEMSTPYEMYRLLGIQKYWSCSLINFRLVLASNKETKKYFVVRCQNDVQQNTKYCSNSISLTIWWDAEKRSIRNWFFQGWL